MGNKIYGMLYVIDVICIDHAFILKCSLKSCLDESKTFIEHVECIIYSRCLCENNMRGKLYSCQ